NDCINIQFVYNTLRFDNQLIERMSGHFCKILTFVLENSDEKLSEIDMLTEEEKNKVLYEFNDTTTNYPKEKTLHQLFEEKVERTPNNTAAVASTRAGELTLTYRELNEKANRLARTLREKGVKSDSIVGILVDRSLEMMVGLFGILKAGGAYLPITPDYPMDRIQYILDDSQTNIVLTQSKLIEKILFNGEVINLEDNKVYSSNGENLRYITTANDLAYVIYTSGSTGQPKGVIIEHQSVVNILTNMQNDYPLMEDGTYLLKTTYTFDVSVTELFGWFMGNGRIAILPPGGEKNLNTIVEAINKYNVTHINFVPSMLNVFLDGIEEEDFEKLNSLRYMFVAGESFPRELARRCSAKLKNVIVENIYGPTETTIYVIRYSTANLKDEHIVPIGKPLNNVKAYVVSKYNQLLPIGVAGELCIAGECLTRGYFNRADLTAEKFVDDPFNHEEKMYRTGDLVRWLPDGNIEFLGRIDHQVKIRGFRIELGEIESQLLNYTPIKEAIVVDREDKNRAKYLCAYVVSGKEVKAGELTPKELRKFLLKILPEYMVPSYFVQLDEMPLNANGKIDRKALPAPESTLIIGTEYEAPRNQTEEKLVEVWKDILGIDKVGINDNFFELGGHSLKATKLVGKIHKVLNVEVSLNQIFNRPTIKGISTYIQNATRTVYEKIKKVDSADYYEASPAQKRMYMLQQFDLSSTSYNMPGVFEVEGMLNVERVEQAFDELLKRHETLRTSFETIDEKIVQRVNSYTSLDVEYIEKIGQTIEEAVNKFIRSFDLTKAPLFRVGVIRLQEDKYILMFDMHHIISDGASIEILVNEFANIYEGKELDSLRIQYKDYAKWQNKLLKSDVMEKQEKYWVNRFSDEVPVLNMPTDYPRSTIQNFEGDSISFKVDKELTKNLDKLPKETGSTIYMVLLSGVNILLSKYSGQEDIIVGSPIAGRSHPDLEKIIGMFVNTITMRNYPNANITYKEFLKQVKENSLEAYENQDYQFEELVEQLDLSRDMSRNPLFDVMFTMQNRQSQNFNNNELVIENLKLKNYNFDHKVSKFDLTISASEITSGTDDEIVLNFEYSTNLYKRETVERMISHFSNILKSVAVDADIKLSEIEMLNKEEKDQVLYEFNNTYADYPRNITLHELFEEKVENTPDNTAVLSRTRAEEMKLTYRELNEKANRLARTLREKGVKSDSIVGILVDRSLEMMVGIFAILKAGAAYLPITPDYPENRIQYILDDSQTSIVLTQSKHIEKVMFNGEVINLEDNKVYSSNGENLKHINTAKDLAYVIYTSGSTGKPKGVLVEHQSVVNILTNMQNDYPLMEDGTYLLKTTYTFDVSVTELFGWFMGNGRIAILPLGGEKDINTILESINKYNVTHINFVPSMLNVFLDGIEEEEFEKLNSLRYMFVAGEAFPQELARRCNAKLKDVTVENIYGPTETTIYVTRYSTANLKDEHIVPIGKSLNNIKAYVLNKYNKLLPIGVSGELCIVGECLTRGYFNRSDLTAEKFVDSPFNSEEKMYRTGDLVRWLPDGNIEFLGRIDHQVKIRGFRIELGEIESQLLNYNLIKEALVVDQEDKNGAKYLCAYVVSEKEINVRELTPKDLREFLLKSLPEYMIPSYFVQLDQMPLNANGKIDRKALTAPEGSIVVGTEYEAPRNETEEKLVEMWKEILGIEKVGINDNFFELGGHSLKATILVSKMHKELDVEVSLGEIFKRSTIKGISEYIQNATKTAHQKIEKVELADYYEASSAQKRMYMLQQFDLSSTSYNMPGMFEVKGKLSLEKVEKAFNELIRRHETLRTSFETIAGKIVQKTNDNVSIKVEMKHISMVNFIKPFDLSTAPLFRVNIVDSEDENYIIMFDMHHIISDGVSMGILISEFADLYQGNKIDELRIQYKDYAAWQTKLLKSNKNKKLEEYWMNRFNDQIPVLNLPTDYQRPAIKSLKGDSMSFILDKQLTKALHKLTNETGSTMYMVLLSGVNILLSKYSSQEDIVIGTPIAGRSHSDLENIIGMFVNTLAMRNYPIGNKTFSQFLNEINENALKAYENQDYQFEELVDKLDLNRDLVRDMSRNPLFDVMFAMNNFNDRDFIFDNLELRTVEYNNKVSKFDLSISANEIGEEIRLDIEYCTDLFKKETVVRMISHLNNILNEVHLNTNIKLSEINTLSEHEKVMILDEFNDTYIGYPKNKTIHQLFEEVVEDVPDHIAVKYENEQLTYRELNEKANRLAKILREKGVKADSIVGLLVERSLEMIVGIMGILKSGGAYMPISSDYPESRILYMLKDSQTDILITQKKFITNDLAAFTQTIDIQDKEIYSEPNTNLTTINTPSNLAYAIYTSGSTGKPKGVMIEHKSVISLVEGLSKIIYARYHSSLNIALLAPYYFDASVQQIFGSLLKKHTLNIVVENVRFDGNKILEFYNMNKIDVSDGTPTHISLLVNAIRKDDYNLGVKHFIIGGESLPAIVVKEFYEKFQNVSNKTTPYITNIYGPTECCVDSIAYLIEPDIIKSLDMIPIGKTMPNEKVYILDKYSHPVAVGVVGEIYLSGEGVGKGYLNNPSLTEEKFSKNPFTNSSVNERMYRTGDLARWLPDGNIEFVGRKDNQVKIRGFRIELGEIETQLLKYNAISKTVVIDRKDQNSNNYLCAYVVSDKVVTVKELREFLLKSLPGYMIPSYFVQLENIPINKNGKVDRKALPKPDSNIIVGTEYEAPRNQTEQKLVEIWKEVLEINKIGINDNFFELGGHSLKAIMLTGKIYKSLNIEVPLNEIFKRATIKGISEYIQKATKKEYLAIEKVDLADFYEASSAQKRMYMLQQFDLSSTSYNMPGVFEVEGMLNVERVEQAFDELLKRHETLRTSFETIDEKIVQRVNSCTSVDLEYIEKADIIIKEPVNKFIRPFDLTKAPLFRVGVIRLQEDKYILMFDMHHIISDGISMQIIINEFATLYEGKEVDNLKIQYKDYAKWQNKLLRSDVMEKQEKYWVNRFSDPIQNDGQVPILNMPTDYPRSTKQNFEGDSISFKVDNELTKNLDRIAKETGSTVYMVLLSGVNILLSKYSGQEDIIVGSPIAGRSHPDLEKIIGMFVNTLAMRNNPNGNMTYKDFLKQVKDNALEAYNHQDYQFEELVEQLDLSRDMSRNPLFDVMFTMQNMQSQNFNNNELIIENLKLKPLYFDHKISKFDLTLSASEVTLSTGDEIIFNLEYSTKLYKRETIERMVLHFRNILKAVVVDADIKLSEIEMLNKEEKDQVLYEFNNTCADYPRDITLYELFEEKVENTPDNIAVVSRTSAGEMSLTYRELNGKANRLARILREKGVKSDSIVSILVDRSFEMIVGIFGILKAGGAYLPITPDYPEDRIQYILDDSQTDIVLTQSEHIEKLMFNGEVINLEDNKLYSSNGENLKHINTAKDLAYVIYTSGSTGKPKGVLVEHQSVVNILTNMQNDYPLMEDGTYLLKTAFTFDVSVTELFGWFMGNGRIAILPPGGEKDLNTIIEAINKYNVTHINFVPSMLNVFIDGVTEEDIEKIISLRYMFVAGEAFQRELARRCNVKLKGVTVENIYGPTETTIYVTRYSIANLKDERIVPIGKPLNNVKAYIVNKFNKLLPIGVFGELCISGECLTRGYLNRSDLTAEKFVDDPFIPEEKMYRTGDLVRWLPDGNIEFLGRIDHQVKIRGFRIELGEIENQLLSYNLIKEALVVDREDKNGAKYLCAYVVSEKEVTVGQLREFLLTSLPEYMIPSYFVQLDEMPLNANGKINRKVLPAPVGSIVVGTEYEVPRNETEEKLVEIWKEILGIENAGINDNFFELGGHSLKATILAAKMHKELDVEVSLGEIFKRPTIKGISEYIHNAIRACAQTAYQKIEKVVPADYYEASSAQKRMYMLQQFDLSSTSYNMPSVLEIEGKLNLELVEKAFDELIKRHETLRTSFDTIDEKIVQRVNSLADVEVEFNYVDFVEYLEKTDKNIEELIKEFIRPFDLSKTSLFRVEIIQLEEDKYILMFDMHHIISDGISMEIFVDEFANLYEGNKLDELKIQYKDYAEWQNNLLKSDLMKKQEEYWNERFSDEIPVVNLLTDYPRPAIQSLEGDSINFKLDKELTKNLEKLAKETGSTMYMVLLSGVNILLSKYSGQEDIIVGSPIAGRPHPDLEKIIGMFVNTLAMRNNPDRNMTYTEFLMDVRNNALQAYENQDYQFEELVEHLALRRDLSRNPLFDVMFTMQNFNNNQLKFKNFELTPYDHDNKIAKFDLTIFASEVGKKIDITLEYCTKLFKQETVKRMFLHLKNILTKVAANPQIKLSDIEMITAEEKDKILNIFNDTIVDYPRDKTIHELFEEQVENNPDQIAVVFGDNKLTYRELNDRANCLAVLLRELRIKENHLVGIMAERSLGLIIGVMAILKSGGAYLSIDPEYPTDRIKYMLEDCSVNVLLTQGDIIIDIDFNFNGRLIDILDEKLYLSKQNLNSLPNINTPENLAYVIYTSGSTGKPKGVMVEHRNVVRLTKNTNYIEFEPRDKILQTGMLTFDASTFEIWGSLLNGLELHLGSKDLILRTDKMAKYLADNQISNLFLTTALFNVMSEEKPDMFKSLKFLLTGGEAASSKHFNQVRRECQNLKIANIYGPTENTTFSTVFFVDQDCSGTIPIGKFINNTTGYVVDKDNNLSPIGVCGELCLGGDGLARGYLNNPELTVEKFIQNPFVDNPFGIILGERMYKTGDMVKLLPDGNIEFIGRIDHQVKIRGFRIELGEIEKSLFEHKDISEVIVIDRKDEKNNKYLCAYFVAHRNITVGELREYLSNNLPDYMIPAYFIQLDKMPLNVNGKIDRKELPIPEGKILVGTEYVAPRNETEEMLVEIWKEVLSVDKVGINDNYFELGGHSLKATILVSKIYKRMDVEMPLSEVFKRPTVKEISEYIKKTNKTVYSAIQKIEDAEYYQTSSAQKRMYMLQQFNLQSTGYNIPGILNVNGRLNLEKVEQVLIKLIERHESLRTSFETIEEKIVQRVIKDVEFKVEYIDKTDKTIEEVVKEFIKPFDLSKAPLFRVGVIELAETESILMFDMHHVISDGTSMGILVNEFTSIYEGKELNSLRIQYKDYAEWQNNLLRSDVMKKQEEYWMGRFNDEVPVLNMPTDYPRSTIQSFEGDSISFNLDKELTKNLEKLVKETGSTMYMVLLSGVNILLSKYSSQEDIIIGSPIAGRPHADLEKIIGMFVNTIAMRNNPNADMTYEKFLKEVRKNALDAYENQDYQFEELVDKLDLRRDLSRNPLFDVMFILQNMDSGELSVQDLNFKPYNYENKTSKFDLTITASDTDEEINLNFEYSIKLFKRETVERMISHFRNILKAVTVDTDTKLSEIKMLNKEEKEQILNEFNNTYEDYPRNKTLHELFEEKVENTPDNIAVVSSTRAEEMTLTYKELNEKANRLARTLREKGVKSDSIVSIIADRSFEMIVGIFGILKVGGAYLPITPDYPEDRIQYIIDDSKTNIVLTQSKYIDKVMFNGEVLDLEDNNVYSSNGENLERINTAKDLAYVIYTSGSTGKPKGVVVEHQSVVNILTNMQNDYPLMEDGTYLLKTTFTFDVSVTELFGWFMGNGRIAILPSGGEKDLNTIVEAINKYDVTHINFVPSMLNVFLDGITEQDIEKITSLGYMFVAGEAFPRELARRCNAILKNVIVENIYGPTETTIYVIRYSTANLKDERIVPIGKPLNNVKAYIVNKYNKLLPIGVAGELCIAGECLTRGYFNRSDLTAEKFVPNLFGKNPFTPEEKMYRTGDLARWLPDGNIEFLGRIDHQVKIRGFRIELGEIESQLLNYNPIKEALVVDREDKNRAKYLCAYVVSEKEVTVGDFTPKELREFLLKSLPEYMIPSYFVQLDEIPINANGKIDRKALPEPEGNILVGTEYEDPRNETDEKLVEMWKDVLGIDKVGINDNFFELGGHSLKATILVAKMHKELNVEVSLNEMFKNPTIKGISEYIQNAIRACAQTAYIAIEPVEPADYYEASSAQ
ncbi:MAG: non-ribosomal peptide synthase/polyketide synthase, partial [Halanaerobiales bacterium]|nr:non-ribosomal peptide synthase/polyketide synthase [Halanaerobiales bacterium]